MLLFLVRNVPDQVVENIEAANIELTEEEIKKIDDLFPVE